MNNEKVHINSFYEKFIIFIFIQFRMYICTIFGQVGEAKGFKETGKYISLKIIDLS